MSGFLRLIFCVGVELANFAIGVVVARFVIWKCVHEAALWIGQEAAGALIQFSDELVFASRNVLNNGTLADGILKIFEDSGELCEALVSRDDVEGEDCGRYDCDGIFVLEVFDELQDVAVAKMNPNRADGKSDEARQADAAVDIEWLFAIVPPAGVKNELHRQGC